MHLNTQHKDTHNHTHTGTRQSGKTPEKGGVEKKRESELERKREGER